MTTISLMTNDQLLIAVQKPTVAAGDQNSVILHIDFDSAWDGFTARSAVFYTSNDATVYEQLLTENECVVPAEVLAETGTLFIGVRGIPTDGSAIKTSSIVNYRIVKGATDGAETTISPALDMYQQYLAAMDAKLAPINEQFAEMVQAFEERTAEVEAEYEQKLAALVQPTVLFDKAAGDDISTLSNMDLSEYNRFSFVVDLSGAIVTHDVLVKDFKHIFMAHNAENTGRQIEATVSDNGITILKSDAYVDVHYIFAYKH